MSLYGLVAVAIGAVFGAWLRWWLGLLLNPVWPSVPLGTLTANLVGGYVIGLATAYFSQHTLLPAEARLLVITGFLGALTTFSTFSAEAVSLLERAQYGWALIHISAHLAGSIVMTVLGILTVKAAQL